LLQTWAQERNAELKCAGASPVVRTLLDLTNLDSVLDVHTTLDDALVSFSEDQICADC
jgi:anti-anti-sigma regulatory factor